ncbi:uncharacterized protein IL334_007790 [Kwoniella shivajii]|uniref:Uncharacterized protein n=1 Tax=Kwoniella shivajii TaxID=564305 RepID=A0ABZ1DCS0_9TREE|nr:hypothetical protein IL334_007790 [Kwoniella shivajii]
MDNQKSRLPRAPSNPAIRPPSSISRLPAPVRLIKQSSLSRPPSLPLRSTRQPVLSKNGSSVIPSTPAVPSRFSQRTLLPSRSTLALSNPTLPSPVRLRTNPAIPLAPKRTISLASKTTTSGRSKPTPSLECEKQQSQHMSQSGSSTDLNNSKAIHVFEPGTKAAYRSQLFGLHSKNRTAFRPKTGFLGLGSPSRSTRLPATPTSHKRFEDIISTPTLPKTESNRWNCIDPDEQIKDLELSFAEDESTDISFVEPLNFGFATSRFASDQASIDPNTDVEVLDRSEIYIDHGQGARRIEAQGVKDTWEQVAGVGEGDLVEIRTMLGLVKTLMHEINGE